MKRCWPWRHCWEIIERIERKGIWGRTKITLIWKCRNCCATCQREAF